VRRPTFRPSVQTEGRVRRGPCEIRERPFGRLVVTAAVGIIATNETVFDGTVGCVCVPVVGSFAAVCDAL
jgi:hypothetical protein